jgi:beta-N-acetylhexosaminidase
VRRQAARRWPLAPAALLLGSAVLAGCAGGGPSATSTTTTQSPPPTTAAPSTTTATTAPPGRPCVAPPARWSDARLAAQLVMVIGSFTSISSLAPESGAGAGGFVFLGQPPASRRTALRAGLAQLGAAAPDRGQVAPWMSTDTEGGTVARLTDVLGPLPSPRQMAGQWTTAQIQSAMRARGAALRGLGITMDLAPVLDTASPTDPVADESQRSFSTTPGVAAADGIAYAAGLRSAGVVAVGKHFPGLGHASANTDTGPATDPPLATLRSVDLVPFERAVAAGLPVVMVGHPVVPGLSGGLPASLSPATYALLRSTLHFTGVALTDSLAAGAVAVAGYSQPRAAVTALAAGADMAMVDAATFQPVLSALEQAISAGTLPATRAEASAGRILAAKGVTVCT